MTFIPIYHCVASRAAVYTTSREARFAHLPAVPDAFSAYTCTYNVMARNADANVGILYKCIIDEIRLGIISDLHVSHEYL